MPGEMLEFLSKMKYYILGVILLIVILLGFLFWDFLKVYWLQTLIGVIALVILALIIFVGVKGAIIIASRMKYYVLIFVPLLILMAMSMMGMTEYNISESFGMMNEFMKVYWVHSLIATVVVAILIWVTVQMRTMIYYKSLQKKRENTKERAEARDMQFSSHRE